MDYARFNYVAQPEDRISEKGLFPRIGVYDKWAIQWGYRYRPEFKDPYKEKDVLRAEVTKKLRGDHRLWFVGDEGKGFDPRSQSEDLGDNNMKANEYGIKNLKRVMENILTWTAQPDGEYTDLTTIYNSVRAQHLKYTLQVQKNIGGRYTNNLPDLKVHDYLPRSLQKEAVEWLGRNLFVAPLWLYPDEVVSRTGVKPVDEIRDRQSSVVALLLAPGMLYNIYCKKHFPKMIGKPYLHKSIAKSMTGFTVWSFWGGLATVGMTQGLNILLNIFFGPGVNAAKAVSSQVENAVQGFVTNFQVAMNPQIIKNYASKEIDKMQGLLFSGCKFSFFLLFLFALPIIVSCPFILKLWLVKIPDHTINFLRITMLILLVNSMSTPVMTAVNATGKIKKYQVIIGSIQLMIVPISYIALRLEAPAESVFVVYLFITLIAQISRLLILKPLINLSIRKFFKKVYYPALKVFFISSIIPGIIWIKYSNSDIVFIIELFVCLLSAIICIYYIGFDREERNFIKLKIKSKINRK